MDLGLRGGRVAAFLLSPAASYITGVMIPVDGRAIRSIRALSHSWFTATGIQPCEVLYEDLAQDRLAVTNTVLEFLRLRRLDAGDLPPVRYRKQADSLTDYYVDLVRSAMNSPG